MIKVENLSKQFGSFTAVNRVSFEVEKGEIFGILGENGAGKTTTLRMLATMLKPTEGTALMAGYDIISASEKVRSKIGILFGGETGLYDRLTCEENIAYFGQLNDMSRDQIDNRIKILAKAFGMEEYIKRRAGKLSKGMKQKVAFARAIIHDPEIMLFDEPTSGLDVSAMKDVHEFIKTCKKDGKTIVFSSHTMSEVEKLCDRIAIINKGELIEKGKIDELKSKYSCDSLEDVFLRLVGDKNES